MGNNINQDSYDGRASFFFFLSFLRYKIDQDRARQIDIARSIGVRAEYVNRVYKGRQTCSVEVQEKICRYFGVSYLEALAMGRHLVETGEMPSGKPPQPDNPPPPAAVHSRRISDAVSDEDVLAVVSQWAAHKKETEGSLARLQNVIENLGHGLVILDANLTVEYQNRAHREMFGASLVGRASWAPLVEIDREGWPGLVAQQTGMPAGGVFPFAKGSVSVLATPLRNTAGQIMGYVEVCHDVTAGGELRLLAEAALVMADLALFICNAGGRIIFHTQKIREITGAGEEALASVDVFLQHLRKNRILLNSVEAAEAMGKAWEEQKEASIALPFRNGETYRFTASPVYSGAKYIGKIGVFASSCSV